MNLSLTLRLDAIRDCFEGALPAIVSTVAQDGMPNVATFSQVQYIDSDHLALSYQFEDRTRQNVRANPRARLVVIHPFTLAQFQVDLEFERGETEGQLFECMQARLAGVASHAGMGSKVRLLGVDLFRVVSITQLPGTTLPPPPPRLNLLSSLRTCSEVVATSTDLERLFSGTLITLQALFDIQHAMVLLYDCQRETLYTMASRGYDISGIGSEIPLGQGLIGVAARERTPIRVSHARAEYAYSRALREQMRQSQPQVALDTEIPFPGLPNARSQLAVPILGQDRLIGVLYVESPEDLRFTYDDEDALCMLAAQMGISVPLLQATADAGDETAAASGAQAAPGAPALTGTPVLVRHFAENDSIFLDDDYLIKGVAGSIFATLVGDLIEKGRTEFTNRELRLDARIRLPDLSDNLEARLLLLSRRLVERNACVRIEKTGRGRFRLAVSQPLRLERGSSSTR